MRFVLFVAIVLVTADVFTLVSPGIAAKTVKLVERLGEWQPTD